MKSRNPVDLSFVGEATRRLNPGLFGAQPSSPVRVEIAPNSPESGPRMRQNRGNRLNKTETAFGEVLRTRNPGVRVRAQAVRLELANGVTYTPDLFAQLPDGTFAAWEVKGPKAWDDAIVKLKVAAREWPEVSFWLASPTDRRMAGWKIERVFP